MNNANESTTPVSTDVAESRLTSLRILEGRMKVQFVSNTDMLDVLLPLNETQSIMLEFLHFRTTAKGRYRNRV